MYHANAGLNISTDLLVAALPVRAIWRLQIVMRQKIALLFILTIGWLYVSHFRLDRLLQSPLKPLQRSRRINYSPLCPHPRSQSCDGHVLVRRPNRLLVRHRSKPSHCLRIYSPHCVPSSSPSFQPSPLASVRSAATRARFRTPNRLETRGAHARFYASRARIASLLLAARRLIWSVVFMGRYVCSTSLRQRVIMSER
jgi:hypothetical protein